MQVLDEAVSKENERAKRKEPKGSFLKSNLSGVGLDA